MVRRLDDSWSKDAACLTDDDKDVFFAHESQTDQQQRAKEICRRCPVREQCLDYALETDQRYGVWGGLTERQRRRLANAAHLPIAEDTRA